MFRSENFLVPPENCSMFETTKETQTVMSVTFKTLALRIPVIAQPKESYLDN